MWERRVRGKSSLAVSSLLFPPAWLEEGVLQMGCYPSLSHKRQEIVVVWLKSEPSLAALPGSMAHPSASPFPGGCSRELALSKSSRRLLLLFEGLPELVGKPIFSVVTG